MAVRAVLAAMAVALTLSACGGAPRAPGHGTDPLSWEDLERDGLGDARLAVLVAPYGEKAGGPGGSGRLGLVDGEGATRFLDRGANPAARLGGRPGTLCAETTKSVVNVSAEGARRQAAPALGSQGVATVVREDGTCLRFVPDGAHGVHREQAGGITTVTTRDLTDIAGVSPGAAWLLGSEDGFGETYDLVRVDLATGATSRAASWSGVVRREPDGRRLLGDVLASRLFWHGGRLHHLLEARAVRNEDDPAEVRPGVRAEIHLVSIDPRTGRRESTPLFGVRQALTSSREGRESSTAWALAEGHLHDGAIVTVNGDGELLAVDLDTRAVRTIGRLSDRAMSAETVGAWHGSRLTLVVREGTARVVREDYDLRTGALVDSQRLDGFDGVLTGGTYLQGAAIVG